MHATCFAGRTETMTTGVGQMLKDVRARLDELGGKTDQLAATWPDAFEDPALGEALAAFRAAHGEATARLAKPCLSIATIGTTSSGKSTMVNALVGRRIAPIEAAEMSGGILTLRHAQRGVLEIGPDTEGVPWTAGRWEALSDEETYGRVREGVMRRYHEERRKRPCCAPEVLVEGPLLPAQHPALLGLPEGIGVEFIDLPGLKSVQDDANLAVIQQRVKKAFCLVALDYGQTDEAHRAKLLGELVDVARQLGGRTDSMVFVLNRVDQRGGDDDPVETRIRVLQHEIREVLGLSHDPDILPFEARLLYGAQCAWGPAPDQAAPTTTPEQRNEYLKKMFADSASSLERVLDLEPELEPWLGGLKASVRAKRDISTEDLRTLLKHVRRWSGGASLWATLRRRIEESFSALVLMPALSEVFTSHGLLASQLETVSRIRKIASLDQLHRERRELHAVQTRLHTEVANTRATFLAKITRATEDLKSGDQAVRARLTDDLGSGFESLLSAIESVVGDLTTKVIQPVRQALQSGRGTYDLEEQLAQVLEPLRANGVAKAYDTFSRRIMKLRRVNGRLVIKVRADDAPAVADLDETERDALRLYQRMREALSARARYTLQGHAETTLGALRGLLEAQGVAIFDTFAKVLPDETIGHAIAQVRSAQLASRKLQLPEELFQLPVAQSQRERTEIEKTGTRYVSEQYTTGTCFKDHHTRTVARDVHGPVAYRELELPDEDGMARQWAEGVRAGEASLWDNLREWMTAALSASAVEFTAAIEVVLRLADRTLADQERQAASGHEAVVAQWTQIDRLIVDQAERRSALKAIAVSGRR
jgi:hypothetical protein